MRPRTRVGLSLAAALVAVGTFGAGVVHRLHESPGREVLLSQAQPRGVTDPRVTQANIQDTICVSGYTAKVRPSSSYTSALKAQQMRERHLHGAPADYEEDHSISLELGGDPISPDNLWPELYAGDYGARTKDRLENYLHKQVCNGVMALENAQRCIAEDWIKCWEAQGRP